MGDVRNVEIFATGSHHPGEKPFTTADLDAMVEAFHALDFKPAVKIGHTDEAGAPAYGWVENLRREGTKLIADLVQLPDDLYQMIRAMRFDRVSAELAFNFERAGRKFAKVLTALALLGQELPAVAGLKPLHASFSVGPLSGEGARVERVFSLPTTKEHDIMTKEELDARDAKLRADMEAKFAAERAAEQARYKAERDAETARYASERAAEQARIAALEGAARKTRIDTLVGSCRFKALQPMLAVFAEIAVNQPTTAKYAVGDKKDLSAEQVLVDLIGEVNKKVVKLFAVAGGNSNVNDDIADDDQNDNVAGMTRAEASERVDTLAKEYMAKNANTDYAKAVVAVLNANAELKAAYTARSTAKAAA